VVFRGWGAPPPPPLAGLGITARVKA
jgi:hypothetical protein